MIHVSGEGAGTMFSGTFHIEDFVAHDGALAVTGRLRGLATTAAAGTTCIGRSITRPAMVRVTSSDVLQLEFDPLPLDLPGLHIDLSRVVLDIAVQSGARGLLGNLLGDVVGLLNDPTALAMQLNSILAAL
jgi:hypothetical protein